MSDAPNAQEAASATEGQNEGRRMRRIRLRQLRTEAQSRAAEAQDATVRIIERNARYSLWFLITATVFTVVTVAAVGFNIWIAVSHTPS
jgi:hypothetical protein